MNGNKRTLVTVVLALAAGLVACGGDSKPTAGEKAFCGALVAFDAVASPDGPGTPAEAAQYAGRVAGPAATLSANAPASVRSAAGTLQQAIDRGRTGDGSAYGEDAARAYSQLERWAYDNCGFQRLSVKARDYTYGGVPKSLKSGQTAIRFENDGEEMHVILWLKRASGDSRPAADVIGSTFEELAAVGFDPDRSRALGFVEGQPAAAPPGQQGHVTMDLAPGRYILFCPVGTHDNEDEPHFAHGMVAEVNVA